jgi:hypothetical protein
MNGIQTYDIYDDFAAEIHGEGSTGYAGFSNFAVC